MMLPTLFNKRSLLLLFVMALPVKLSAETLTWIGSGDGTTFNQLQNWSGTPTGGTIDLANLVDDYIIDSSATITGVTNSLQFKGGGSLQMSAGSLNTLSSGGFGLGELESPQSFGSLQLTGGSLTTQFLAEMTATISGEASLTLAGGNNPVNVTTVNITSDNSTVRFLNETPNDFRSEHLGKFTVFGQPAVEGINLDISSDGGAGTIVSSLISLEPNVRLLVDRDSGNLTLSNQTGQPIEFFEYDILSTGGALLESNWTSISENYDASSNGGDESVDDDTWIRFTRSNSTTDLAEGTFGEATLVSPQTIDLGNAWNPTPVEDLIATLALTNGSDLVVDVVYSGSPILPADFDASGSVDTVDWGILRTNLFTNTSSMLTVDRYASGDIDANGKVDEQDFLLFQQAFDLQNGSGAFAALQSPVPEPSSLCVVVGFINLALIRAIQLRR